MASSWEEKDSHVSFISTFDRLTQQTAEEQERLIRPRLRKVFSTIDEQIGSYSELFGEVNHAIDNGHSLQQLQTLSARVQSTETRIEDYFLEATGLCDTLDSVVTPSRSLSPSSDNRESINMYRAQYQSTNKSIHGLLDRFDLLGRPSIPYPGDRESTLSVLSKERGSINSSHAIADSAVSQATETVRSLQEQTATLKRDRAAIRNIQETMGDIRRQISSVASRKWRNLIIIALVIGICVSFLILYGLMSS